MHFSLAALSFLLAAAIAAPASKRHVIHERREKLPRHWEANAKLHEDSYLPLRIALKQSNLESADDFLMDVSSPDSPNFGKHWTAKEVAEKFAPSEKTVSMVMNWLLEFGITNDRVKQSQGLNWIHADVSVSEAESLLKTKYYEFKHAETGQRQVACQHYSLPEDIQRHVDFITPTIHFDAKVAKPKRKRDIDERTIPNPQPGTAHSIGSPSDKSLPKLGGKVPFGTILDQLKNCDNAIVPNCLRALYEFPPYIPANPKNSYGIVEYTPQAYLPSDLDMFFKKFSSAQVGQRPIFDSIDGGVLQTDHQSFGYNSESDLDLEYAMALVYPQKVTVYQVGDLAEGGSFNNFLDAIDGSYCTYEGGDDPTQDGIYPDPANAGPGVYKGPENCGGFAATKVISTSYSYNEVDLSPFYEMRQCHEYMKIGLQGVTVIYSSGDYGVAGEGGQCIDTATGKLNNGTSGMFNPTFPSTCPYVTSVGATQVKKGASVTAPEKAAESEIYSGGGFSNVFSVPSYQKSAVSTYFKKHKPSYTSAQYNTSQTSRGIPDVSANGVNYVVAVNGNFTYIYGTSASAPTFGSVITLINTARLDIGKSSVGFINPVIYGNPSMFNDITEGGNQGCGTKGFSAVPGWDPVTGLGTPNFPKMVAYWLALP